MSDTETVRCPCGRLHQIPKAIDPSSELARVTAQNGAYRKQIDRQVEEVKRLTAVSKTLQTMNADGKAEVERLRAELRYIAEAKPLRWGDMADQFQKWAQNRARHALTGGRE